ncbi:extracellular solute-binding protein [Metasolibacillus meyeri]|uniref:Extracellular solute-binding protein n=1 Tax=Metasolibacillus meyeri TaxID=1071052 RepID=A0AAW9NUF2_9BACL|nr:extracellular solute-binding protein [Metasolibacillus meyeri]MEC1178421.1 extracellular solute-binding protein [Metasolibacillus meyeri]
MKQRGKKWFLLLVSIILFLTVYLFYKNNWGQHSEDKQQVVNVYTARHYQIDNEIFQEFTRQTGIQVNEVKGTAEELIERMIREGEASSADLFIAVDGGVLNFAKQSEVLQPLTSKLLIQNVPAEWRDSDNYWVGIATRSRVIVYAKDRVSPSELSTYEDLTNEQWEGKVLVRSASSLYNQSLLASFIELSGESEAEKWAAGIVRNLSRNPEGGDKAQAKAIATNIGDVAIMNTYYIGQMSVSPDPEEREIAEQLGVLFPNQQTTGAHVNISGVGLAKYAPNKDNALKLAEFLTSREGQTMLTQGSYEFPVNVEADMPEMLKDWGSFKRQPVDIANLGYFHKQAAEIFEKVGWQ